MNLLLNRKYLLFIIIAFSIVAILIIILAFYWFSSGTTKPISPTPTPIQIPPITPISTSGFQYSEQYKKSVNEIRKQEEEILMRQSLVHDLIKKLPYSGQYFTASYDISTNLMTVTTKKDFENEANKELNEFLKKNGILSIDWIRDIKIITE